MAFYHGTRHPFKPGDLVVPSCETPNGGNWANSSPYHVYFADREDTAAWAAEHATGPKRRQAIYEVEPTGSYEEDPNMPLFDDGSQDSYRSEHPLVIKAILPWPKRKESK